MHEKVENRTKSVVMDTLTNHWNEEDLHDSRVRAYCSPGKKRKSLMQTLKWADKKDALLFLRKANTSRDRAKIGLGDVFNDPTLNDSNS